MDKLYEVVSFHRGEWIADAVGENPPRTLECEEDIACLLKGFCGPNSPLEPTEFETYIAERSCNVETNREPDEPPGLHLRHGIPFSDLATLKTAFGMAESATG